MLKALLLTLIITLLSTTALADRLIFLHLTDTHNIAETQDKPKSISLARAIYKANEIKKNNPDAKIIFVHSGDFLAPSLSSRTFEGRDIVEALNVTGIEVGTIGNHEFDYGSKVLMDRLKELKFPIINSNIINKTNGQLFDGVVPYYILNKDDIQIAFVGAVTIETQTTLNKFSDAFEIKDPVESIRRTVDEIRFSNKADLIVGVTHLTNKEDRNLATQVIGIDLILGGHEHMILNEKINDILISKVRNDVKDLNVVELNVNRKQDGKIYVVDSKSTPIALNRSIPTDIKTQRVIEKYQLELTQKLSTKIAHLSQSYDGTKKGLTEELKTSSPKLGGLVVGLCREALGGDVAFFNVGVIARSNRTYGPGPLKMSDLQSLIPYLDQPVAIETTGQVVRNKLEEMLAIGSVPSQAASLPITSGLDIVWDLTKPNGQRILRLNYRGAPLEDNQKLKLVVNKYIYMSDPILKNERLLTPLETLRTEYEIILEGLKKHFPPTCEEVL